MTTEQTTYTPNERTERIEAALDDQDTPALLIEPREVFDACLLGTTDREAGNSVAVYDARQCIQALMTHDGIEHDDAREHFEFNIMPMTGMAGGPLFIDTDY